MGKIAESSHVQCTRYIYIYNYMSEAKIRSTESQVLDVCRICTGALLHDVHFPSAMHEIDSKFEITAHCALRLARGIFKYSNTYEI